MNPNQQFWPVADQRFPWLTSNQVKMLENLTSNLTGIDKLKAQWELYEQAIQQINTQKVNNDRFAAENEKFCRSLSKDEKSMTTDQCSVKLEKLADIVKDYYNLNANTPTDNVIDWVVKMARDKNVDTDWINKFIQDWDRTFLYEMWWEERPKDSEWWQPSRLRAAWYAFNPLMQWTSDLSNWIWSHPKEDAEMAVWFAQSPWKWWYNLMGQWMDKLGKSMADKLEGTELADWVKQTAIDMFWEDEVRAFAEQKQQELANWTAFKGRDQTDIRTPLLWEERANSWWTQAWEAAWDIATAIALSYPMASALAPYMWLNTASQAWRTLLLWAAQWAIDNAAYEYWANQELPSLAETAVFAWLWGLTPFAVPFLKWASKQISNKYDEIRQVFRNSAKEKLWEELKTLFSKWIKPSAAWVKSTKAQEKIYDNAMDAVETIINNKKNLKFTNANWEIIEWQLPTNSYEFAQAIDQTKQAIYKQYNAIAQEAWQEARVSLDWLTEELLKLKNDRAALLWNPWLENSIDWWLRWLSEVEDLSVEQAQRKIQEINKKLEAFYRNPNPNDVSGSSVDSLVKNKLQEAMDEAIDSALWNSAEYKQLKKAYSSLKAIEKDVNHRAIVSWRQSPNSLVDSIADISSVDSLLDILSWNPLGAVKAVGKQAIKKYIKNANNSDNMVKTLFQKAEWEFNKNGSLKAVKDIRSKKYILNNLERYKEAKIEYDQFLDWMASDLWGTALKPPLKILNWDWTVKESWINRVIEKAADKINWVDWVTDIVRWTTAVKDNESMQKAIDWVKSRWYELDDKFTNPTDLWYKDLSFLYEAKNWIKAEVQINTPEMLVAKEWEWAIDMWVVTREQYDKMVEAAWEEWGKWHKYYEEWRDLKEKKKNWSISPEEADKRMAAIEKESQAYYQKFENLWKKSWNNVAADYNKYSGIAKEIIDNQWITLDVVWNNNLWGKPYVAVSPYPNRSKIIKVEDFSDEQVYNYFRENADKLFDDGYVLWGWVNDWNVYLDVSIALPKSMQNEAVEIANKYNQKAIFDLENFEDIPTQWNGEFMEVNEDEISNYIKSLFNKKQ